MISDAFNLFPLGSFSGAGLFSANALHDLFMVKFWLNYFIIFLPGTVYYVALDFVNKIKDYLLILYYISIRYNTA